MAMPIYEYVCQECSRRFETIVVDSSQVECPFCRSAKLQKQLSVFAVGAAETTPERGSLPECASCDPRRPACGQKL